MARFHSQVVVDAGGAPLANAVGQIFAMEDFANTTPLAIFDASGTAIPLNQLIANNDGVVPEFSTNYSLVRWVSGPYALGMIAYDLIPAGGTTGQALLKKTSNDYDMEWANPAGFPAGGLDGQFLAKDGLDPYETRWEDPPMGGGGSDLGVKAFGAVGDGVADDTFAIQQALNEGGAVYFPPGDYKISAPLRVETEAMFLYGRGTGNRSGAYQPALGSRIVAAPGMIGEAMILVQPAANDRPIQGVVIQDLAIDGGAYGTNVDGVLFRVSQGSMHNVHIWRTSGVGLHIKGYGAPAPWDTYDTRFTSLLVGDCTGSGVWLDEGATDIHMSHSILFRNQDNMLLTGGGSAQVTGVHFYDAARNDIRFAGSGSRSKFSNCKIEGAAEHLVLIDSTVAGYADIQFTGCGFANINQGSATNTWDYVHVMGPTGNGISRNTFIANNFSLKGGSTVKARYAINIASTASQGTMVLSNSFGPTSSWGTGPLNNASNNATLQNIKGNGGLSDVVLPVPVTANYTLLPSDADTARVVEVTSATGVTVTVPPTSSGGVFKGCVFKVAQMGAGQITFAPGAGVTLRTPRSLTTRVQWSQVTIRCTGTNSYILEGDLT
jgi:hypothetical protein